MLYTVLYPATAGNNYRRRCCSGPENNIPDLEDPAFTFRFRLLATKNTCNNFAVEDKKNDIKLIISNLITCILTKFL